MPFPYLGYQLILIFLGRKDGAPTVPVYLLFVGCVSEA
jgi:hypothetical protein